MAAQVASRRYWRSVVRARRERSSGLTDFAQGTCRTDTEDEEIVTCRGKPCRQWNLLRNMANVKIVDAPTLLTQKVMMVSLARNLISSHLPGHLNGLEPAFFNKTMDVPIGSRNAQALRVALRDHENLLRRQWAILKNERASNCVLLLCPFSSIALEWCSLCRGSWDHRDDPRRRLRKAARGLC